jgi:hypothetical protein
VLPHAIEHLPNKITQAFTDAIMKVIVDTNNNGAVVTKNAAKIQKFAILDHDISVETDELTPTYKLKRGFTHQKYADAIAQIYASKESYVLVETGLEPPPPQDAADSGGGGGGGAAVVNTQPSPAGPPLFDSASQ